MKKKIYNEQNDYYICKKGFSTENGNKKHHKIRDHCLFTAKCRGDAQSIVLYQIYKIPKEIPIIFYSGSINDYHFIIKDLAEDFEGFGCLGENTEKYITFLVPTRK